MIISLPTFIKPLNLKAGARGIGVPPISRGGQVQDHLRNLNIQKCMGHNEIPPRVLTEFADVVENYS